LLNRLAQEERSVVDAVAGTTVDPVDSLVQIGGETWLLVDTAGLRRKVGTASGTEYYASLRTAGAIEAAEVAVVLIDAAEPISEQDQRVLSMVTDAGRALVIAFNKWDLMDPDRRYFLDKELDRDLKRIPWALKVNISAKTGRAVEKLAPALRQSLASWEQRVPTGPLNQFITSVVQATPHPVRGGRSPRVLFCTQAGVRPPKFVLFTSGPLDAGYVRFVERKLREEFGFDGSPIAISVRPRKKKLS
jgi:GTP-binding protein